MLNIWLQVTLLTVRLAESVEMIWVVGHITPSLALSCSL